MLGSASAGVSAAATARRRHRDRPRCDRSGIRGIAPCGTRRLPMAARRRNRPRRRSGERTFLHVKVGQTGTLTYPHAEGDRFILADSRVTVVGIHGNPQRFLAYADTSDAARAPPPLAGRSRGTPPPLHRGAEARPQADRPAICERTPRVGGPRRGPRVAHRVSVEDSHSIGGADPRRAHAIGRWRKSGIADAHARIHARLRKPLETVDRRGRTSLDNRLSGAAHEGLESSPVR